MKPIVRTTGLKFNLEIHQVSIPLYNDNNNIIIIIIIISQLRQLLFYSNVPTIATKLEMEKKWLVNHKLKRITQYNDSSIAVIRIQYIPFVLDNL